MFEDSTFESTGRIHTRSRAWSVATFAVNTTILVALIVIPLIYPEALPQRLTAILLSAPPPPPAAPKPPELKPSQAFQGHREFPDLGLTAPIQIPQWIRETTRREDQPPNANIASWDSGPAVGNNLFNNGAARTPRVVSTPPSGPQRITSTLAEGLLLNRVVPTYPPIAREAGIQGTVVLEATISTSGAIVNLRAVSGPQMLQQAAIDAVSRWRYRPYLLNGQPVEVETTVNVVFSFGQ